MRAGACVFEMFGLPGVGKTTITTELVQLLQAQGHQVCTRDVATAWLRTLSPIRRWRMRIAAIGQILAHPWMGLKCLREAGPLSLRRYFNLFMKRQVLSTLAKSGRYDAFVFDQWALQDVWSLLIRNASACASAPAPASLMRDLLQVVTTGEAAGCVRAPTEEVAARLSKRSHGLSRFDGLSLDASREKMQAVERYTDDLLTLAAGSHRLLEIDAMLDARENATKISAWLGASVSRLIVVTPNYPRPGEEERGAFVERLVAQWKRVGVSSAVISPLPAISLSRRSQPAGRAAGTIAGQPIVYPRYLSMSARRIGPIDLRHLSQQNFIRAAISAQRGLGVPDAFYGKFLFTGAAAAVRLAKEHNRPAFADLGESTLLAGLDALGRYSASTILQACAGVVCVSPRLLDEARELGVPNDRLLLSPNVADPRVFHPLDRAECRRTLGLPANDFIVVFVGHFIERKGPLRVLEAINLAGGRVKGVFLGRGAQMPSGERVLHAAPVPNEDLPRWLNAADALVLPTLAEGCCNAIAEAMACGLPVISSDIADVRWQVPPGAGRLVDPNDVVAISQAIRECEAQAISTDAPRRASVAGGERAEAILAWMQVRVEQWNSGHR